MVESYIKVTINFPRKFKESGSLLKSVVLCTTDVADLYPNILHNEDLASIKEHLDNREDKKVTTSTLVGLAGLKETTTSSS